MTIVRQRDHSGEGHRWLPDYLNQIPPTQKSSKLKLEK